MDYRGIGFGGDGNLEIMLLVAAVWLVVFIFVRMRKAMTGRDGNVGAITFGITVNAIFGLFLAGAAFVPAWLISSILVIGFAAISGQTVQDLVTLHWWLMGGAFFLAAVGILLWLRPER
nr:hypothetical protein [uncultured Devosia sp.]